MLLQQSCPSAHSTWQALGYQKAEEEEEEEEKGLEKNPPLS